jgi:hypothetical protein
MYAAFADYWVWANQAKVCFDGDNKLILINPGVTDVNVEQDIYSDWKEWMALYDYMKYEAAVRNVGGDPINDQGDKLGATFFLINDWKIRTWEGNHNLSVVGNLYSDDGLSPFVPTIDDWNILITSTVSNLIDKVGLNALAGEVWDQVLNQHQIGGSTGKALKDALKIIKVLLANS